MLCPVSQPVPDSIPGVKILVFPMDLRVYIRGSPPPFPTPPAPGELPHDVVLLVTYPRLFLSATQLPLASRNVVGGLHRGVTL